MNDKYISRDNLELAIDGLKVGMTKDWNENDKNAVGYIENRPFYTEYGVIVDNYSGSGKLPKCDFVVGNTYDVIWNGVTYKGLVCRTDGEYNFIGGDRYPFYIDNDGGNGFYVEPESGFTVSILGDIVHQLDEKYIPDSVARVEDVEEVFDEIDVLKMNAENPVGSGSFSMNRKVGSVIGKLSHAEGCQTTASGDYSHAEGLSTHATTDSSATVTVSDLSIIKGGYAAHAEGYGTIASGTVSHAEGCKTQATANTSATPSVTAFDTISLHKGYATHAEGYGTVAHGAAAHAEGYGTTASGNYSHAEGSHSVASGVSSHAEGSNSTASGNLSHAEGGSSTASGNSSHAEGDQTTASGNSSHAEGDQTTASGDYSHAEGYITTASGNYSHAEGHITTASGDCSHAEGDYTTASGDYSHAEGYKTTASSQHQHTQGKYNIEDSVSTYAHIVGNGTSNTKRSNAHTLDWNGVGWFQGGLQIGGTAQDGEGVGYVPAVSGPVQPGQLLSVKAVDENGKPTEWETLDPLTIFEEFGFTVDENGTLVGGVVGGGTPTTANTVVMTDEVTGVQYKLSVADGKLKMTEVISE